MLDRLYVYSYALLLETPSRKSAAESAAILVPIVILFNAVSILAIVSGVIGTNLLNTFGKAGLIAGGLIVMVPCFTYYAFSSNGGRLVKTHAKEIASRKAKLLGLGIAVWSFLFPILSGGIIIAIKRLILAQSH
jgi:hypothetical protein